MHQPFSAGDDCAPGEQLEMSEDIVEYDNGCGGATARGSPTTKNYPSPKKGRTDPPALWFYVLCSPSACCTGAQRLKTTTLPEASPSSQPPLCTCSFSSDFFRLGSNAASSMKSFLIALANTEDSLSPHYIKAPCLSSQFLHYEVSSLHACLCLSLFFPFLPTLNAWLCTLLRNHREFALPSLVAGQRSSHKVASLSSAASAQTATMSECLKEIPSRLLSPVLPRARVGGGFGNEHSKQCCEPCLSGGGGFC